MHSIDFLSDAINDLDNVRNWYEHKQPGLGSSFENNVMIAVENLQSEVVIHKPLFRGLSRVFVKRFPYNIYFKKYRNVIVIYAVLHMKQSKSHLNKRL